jgi:hypothetical protein
VSVSVERAELQAANRAEEKHSSIKSVRKFFLMVKPFPDEIVYLPKEPKGKRALV